jgi:periplasmic protein TonB
MSEAKQQSRDDAHCPDPVRTPAAQVIRGDRLTIPPNPEPSTRIARTVFAVSLAVHGSLVWVLHVSASEPVRIVPDQIEVELAPPPPPKKEPEPEREPEQPQQAPPPRQARTPVPRLTPSAAPAETAKTPEEVGTDIPQGDEGELPPAPAGLAPPAPEPVVAAPAPPPPAPIIEAREGANYLNNPRPPYPRRALRDGLQGRVILRVRVLPNGKVESARVQTSAGHEALDEAALEVVKSWSFVPATQAGKPIAGWVSVPFEFRIQ